MEDGNCLLVDVNFSNIIRSLKNALKKFPWIGSGDFSGMCPRSGERARELREMERVVRQETAFTPAGFLDTLTKAGPEK
jgi:hypothetical protein